MKTKVTSMTAATLFISLLMPTLVGCASIPASASETGESSISTEDGSLDLFAKTDAENAEAAADTDEDASSSDASVEVPDNLEDFQFVYNGSVISAMDDFETLDKALGGYDQGRSAAESYEYGDGTKRNIRVYVLEKDGSKLPITLTIEGDMVATSRKIKVGSTKEEVLAAYGDPNVEPPKAYGPDGKELTRDAYIEMFGENLIYNLGDCQINFYVEEGKVSSIVYQNNKNHDKFSWS